MFRKLIQALFDRRRKSSLAFAKDRLAYEASLLAPDFDAVSRHYGNPISSSLKSLYEDEAELMKAYVTKVIPGRPEDQWLFVACYNALNESEIKGQRLQDGMHFAFAADGSGSQYVVDPTDESAEILFFEHETGELKSTGVSFAQYLQLSDDL